MMSKHLSGLYLFLIFIISAPDVFGQIEYDKVFPAEYRDAVEYLENNLTIISTEIRKRNGDVDVLVPVVFPELLRYSIVRDQIETTGLKIFYVHVSDEFPKFSNFSIGRFQMKPRFIEELEEAVSSLGLTTMFADVLEYRPGSSEKEIRRQRVQRLESAVWQAVYLACFGAVMQTRFSHLAWDSIEDKITFYATAYNHGFNCTEEEIRRWMDARIFPYGIDYPREQHAYADVSRYFYRTTWKKAVQK